MIESNYAYHTKPPIYPRFSFRKHIISFFSFVFFAAPLHAQGGMTVQNVEINNLSLDKQTYSPGGTIHGSFTFVNGDSVDYPDVYFNYQLVQINPATGVIENNYGFVQDETATFIPKNQSKTIPFTFTVPQFGQSENLSLMVSAVRGGGELLTFSRQPVEITGLSLPFSITSSSLTVGANQYSLQDGPMVNNGQTPTLNLSLINNSSNASQSITPDVKVHNLSPAGPVVAEQDYPNQTLNASSSLSINIPLPVIGYKPGIYLAEVNLLDQNGKSETGSFFVRYIIAGPIVTIPAISIDRPVGEKGDPIKLVVNYTGSPSDIDTGEVQSVGTGTLAAVLTNEKGEVIAEQADNVNLDGFSNTYTFNLVASTSYEKVNALVIASKDGTELARYQTNLTNPDQPTVHSSFSTPLTVGIAAFVAILIIIFSMIYFRKKKSAVMMILAIFLVGFSLLSHPVKTEAATYSNSTTQSFKYTTCSRGCTTKTTNISFSASVYTQNNNTVSPGESLLAAINGVTGSANVCENTRKFNITYSSNGQSVGQNYNDSRGGHDIGNYTSGTITPPGTNSFIFGPGSYTLNVQVQFTGVYGDEVNDNHSVTMQVGLDIPITVSQCSAGTQWNGSSCVTLKANGSCGAFNGSVNNSPYVVPSSSQLCSAGTSSLMQAGTSSWAWTCNGVYGGTNASCSASLASGICENGYVYGSNGQCVPNTCTNLANNPPACSNQCLNGAYNPPICNTCPSGKTLGSNGQCQTNSCTNGANNPPACNNACPAGEVFNSNNVCVSTNVTCPAGETLINGICVTNSGTCANGANNPPLCNFCPAGYTFGSDGQCYLANKCGNGSNNYPACNNACTGGEVFNADNVCTCPTGETLINATCRTNPVYKEF